MNRCRSCGLAIGDHDTARYREWCGSMRRLLILRMVQPEDYHRDCFVNCMVAEEARETRTDRRVVAASAFLAVSAPVELLVRAVARQ
jgi:hypothetical protein